MSPKAAKQPAVSSANVPMMTQTQLPVLPEELARQIVQHLDNRSACNASRASKAFWRQWGFAMSSVAASATLHCPESAQAVCTPAFKSLQPFLARRCPQGLKVCTALHHPMLATSRCAGSHDCVRAQVESLHLSMHKDGTLAVFNRYLFKYMQANIQLCSATITTLRLRRCTWKG